MIRGNGESIQSPVSEGDAVDDYPGAQIDHPYQPIVVRTHPYREVMA